ncbi:MAG: enoyl-CoA hydratase/isomerase family protein [Promethearchaeota archaeon]
MSIQENIIDFESKGRKIKYWILKYDSDGIYWLVLNRIDKRNAFNDEVIDELEYIAKYLKLNEEINILVITTASDEYFSAGADIEMFLKIDPSDKKKAYEQGKEISVRIQDVFAQIEALPYPVIAAVKGLNLTAGLELSLCCDLIIAADNAKFGQIETKWGITPGGGGTQRLTRLIGPLKAKELIFTSKIIDAFEAEKIGLVNKVVPLAQLEDETRELCRRILKNSKRAVMESKFLINEALYESEVGFMKENKIFGEDFKSGEPQKLLGEFLAKKRK